MALALTIFTGTFTEIFPGQEDRSVEDRTISNVWQEIRTNGIYDNDNAPTLSDIDPNRLPDGYVVYVNVTRIQENGVETELDGVGFEATNTYSDMDPPESADAVSRPIPIKLEPGEVVGGSLNVWVWQER